MQSIKRKWFKIQTATRLRKLWQEFLQVSQGDKVIKQSKLNAFLDTFQTVLVEYPTVSSQNREHIDKILKECTDLVNVLLNQILSYLEDEATSPEGGVNQVFNKIINVAELILRDEKYRETLRDTPLVINQVLSLLEKVQSKEAKKLLLRLITSLGENLENKMEIGRRQGFRKMLRLLLDKDEELTREILRTLKRFLDASAMEPERSNGNQPISTEQGSQNHNSVTDKIKNVLNELSKLAMSEFHRVFPNNDSEDIAQESNVSPFSHRLNARISLGSFDELESTNESTWPPSASVVARVLKRLQEQEAGTIDIFDITSPKKIPEPSREIKSVPEFVLADRSLSRSSVDISADKPRERSITANGSESSSDSRTSSIAPAPGTRSRISSTTDQLMAELSASLADGGVLDDQVLQEFMRVQGALSTLTNTLAQAAMEVQLDLMETISRLLFNNQRNQKEFRKIDGYGFILQLFRGSIRDYSSVEAQAFLRGCFNIIYTITMDGKKSKVVGNLDALRLIFRVIQADSAQWEVVVEALTCLKDLVGLSYENVASFQHIGGLPILLQLLRKSCWTVSGGDSTIVGSEGQGTTASAFASAEGFFSVLSSTGDAGSEQQLTTGLQHDVEGGWAVCNAVDQLLRYCFFILHDFSYEIPITYIDILAHLPPHALAAKALLLKSIKDMLSDINARPPSTRMAFGPTAMSQLLKLLAETVGIVRGPEAPVYPGAIPRPRDFTVSVAAYSSPLVNRKRNVHSSPIIMSRKPVDEELTQFSLDSSATAPSASATDKQPLRVTTKESEEGLLDFSMDGEIEPCRCEKCTAERSLASPNATFRPKSCSATSATGSPSPFIAVDNEPLHTLFDLLEIVGYLIKAESLAPKYPKALLDVFSSFPVSQYKRDFDMLIGDKDAMRSTMNDTVIQEDIEGENGGTSGKEQVKVSTPTLTPTSTATATAPTVNAGAAAANRSPNTPSPRKSISVSCDISCFDCLYDLICTPGLPEALVDLSLFVLRDLIVEGSNRIDSCRVLVSLLRETAFPTFLKLKIYHTVSSVMRVKGSKASIVKSQFRVAGGLQQLLHIVRSSHSLVSSAAFKAFGDAISNSDENKKYIGEEVGFISLANSIKNSSVVLDRTAFEYVLELSTTGNFKEIVSVHERETSSEPTQQADDISNFPRQQFDLTSEEGWAEEHNYNIFETIAHNIQTPSPLFTEPLLTSRKELGSFLTHDVGSPRGSSSGSGSVHESLTPRASLLSSSDVRSGLSSSSLPSMSAPHHAAHKEDTYHDMESGGGRQGSSNVEEEGEQALTKESSDRLLARKLASIRFRSVEASLMIVLLLPSAPIDVQKDVIDLLLVLLEANPSNKRALCEMHVLSFLLRLCHRLPREVQPSYVRFIVSLGVYDISPKETKLFLELARIPPSLAAHQFNSNFNSDDDNAVSDAQTAEGSLEQLLLGAFCQIVERAAPPSYFHLDGTGGRIKLSPLDRFPSAKVGYSLCFWMKVGFFADKEASLLSWEDSASCTLFELYFGSMLDTAPGSKRCLWVRTQQSASGPSETFSFDQCAFEEYGDWHYLVLTHNKRTQSLFVNGRHVQTCKPTNSYCLHASKEKPLLCSIGGGANGEVKRRFSGQLGAVHILEGGLEESATRAVFLQGPLFESSYKTIGVDHKRVVSLLPSSLASSTFSDVHSSREKHRGSLVVVSTVPSSGPSSGSSSVRAEQPLSVSAAFTTSPVSSQSTSASDVVPAVPSTRRSISSTPSRRDRETQEFHGAELEAGADVHVTRSIKTVIREIDGLQICLSFLLRSDKHAHTFSPTQVTGLRILAGLLERNATNLEMFSDMSGWNMLYNFLRPSPPSSSASAASSSSSASSSSLSATATGNGDSSPGTYCRPRMDGEVFGVLLTLACDSIESDGQLHIDPRRIRCIQLLVDLLHDCGGEVAARAIDTFSDMMTLESNVQAWREGPGLTSLLELAVIYKEVHSHVLSFIEKLAPTFLQEEVELLFEFVTTNVDELSGFKADLLNLIWHQLLIHSTLLDKLYTAGGFQLLFTILGCPSEPMRHCAIKMIGLLLHASPKNKLLFTKSYGFDQMVHVLTPYRPSSTTCHLLLGLALDAFQAHYDSNTQPASVQTSAASNTSSTPSSSPPSSSATATTAGGSVQAPQKAMQRRGSWTAGTEIVHAEAVDVLLAIAKSLEREETKLKVLHSLDKILDPGNLERLADYPLLTWIWDFLYSQSNASTSSLIASVANSFVSEEGDSPLITMPLNGDSRVHTLVYAIVTKIVIFDMQRPLKQSRLQRWLNEIADAENFQVHIIEDILSYFESNPHLPAESAMNYVKSLAQLFEHLEEFVELTPDLCLRIMNCISVLAVQNTYEVRNMMKEASLFDVRDDLLLYGLRGEFSTQERLDMLCSSSFETVAVLPKFREAHGILYLFKFLHEEQDRSLQVAIIEVLRNILGASDENRKAIQRIVDDSEMMTRLFAQLPVPPPSSGAGLGGRPSCLRIRHRDTSESMEDYGAGMADSCVEEFLDWYQSAEQRPRWQLVQARVLKQLSPIEGTFKKQGDRSEQSKVKKRKNLLIKKANSRSGLVTNILEFEEKRRQRVQRSQDNTENRMEKERQEREKRYTLGAEAWDLVSSFHTVQIYDVSTSVSRSSSELRKEGWTADTEQDQQTEGKSSTSQLPNQDESSGPSAEQKAKLSLKNNSCSHCEKRFDHLQDRICHEILDHE
eukprot:GILJ01007613.1.p1 GENE.GILJ01007613.1~~GILJ01007613.1.p1  ORF type:complete len:2709 (-),score=449.42 GILJ01007613.1:350-8476(-)